MHTSEKPNEAPLTDMNMSVHRSSPHFSDKMMDHMVGTQGIADHSIFVNDLSRGLRDAEDVLRALAPFTHRFQITGVDVNISMDLIRFMFEAVWLNIHAIVENVLSSMEHEELVLYSALDILCSALTASIFLDLRMERLAFATLLINFRKICNSNNKNLISNRNGGVKDISKWFEFVQNATPENAMDAISQMHSFVILLKDDIREKTKKDTLKLILNRIEKSSHLLDKNTSFIRDGNLSKRSRTGRF